MARRILSPAAGSTKGINFKGFRRVVVAFPDDQFEEIRQRALKEQTSFAEQVRLLCEWGLEADKEN